MFTLKSVWCKVITCVMLTSKVELTYFNNAAEYLIPPYDRQVFLKTNALHLTIISVDQQEQKIIPIRTFISAVYVVVIHCNTFGPRNSLHWRTLHGILYSILF